MFGAHVPVCAVSYPAISELVVNGINGIIFKDAQELSMHLMRLLSHYPENQEELCRMKSHIAEIESWDVYWSKECEPCIQRALANKTTYGVSRNRFCVAILLISLFCLFSLENSIYIALKFLSSEGSSGSIR
jgi:hypothetical protein